MNPDRRKFIERLAFLGAGAYFGPVALSWRRDVQAASQPPSALWLACGDGEDEKPRDTPFNSVESRPGAAVFYSIDTKRVVRVALPFKPHTLFQSRTDSALFAATEKWGHHLTLIDLSGAKASVCLDSRVRRFFGHGIFSGDGQFIYASQFDDKKSRGVIGIFDARSGERIGEHPSYGDYPHDLQMDGSGNLLVMNVNLLSKPDRPNALQCIEPKTGALLHSRQFHLSKSRDVVHFAQGSDGWIVACGITSKLKAMQEPGCIVALSPAGSLQEIKLEPEQMQELTGESLSIALDQFGERALVTSPASSSVFVWEFKRNRVARVLNISDPRGVVYFHETNDFFVSTGHQRKLIRVNSQDWNGFETVLGSGVWGVGAHMGIFRVSQRESKTNA